MMLIALGIAGLAVISAGLLTGNIIVTHGGGKIKMIVIEKEEKEEEEK